MPVGSAIVGHATRESFMRAVSGPPQVPCLFCRGFADAIDHVRGCPHIEPASNAQVIAGLRNAWAHRAPPTPPSKDLRREGRERMERNRERSMSDPVLATDGEIRRATRTGFEQ